MIAIRLDDRSARAELRALEDKVQTQVISRAMNRVATSVNSTAVKEIAQRAGLKQKDVRGDVKIVQRANKRSLVAVVAGTGRRRLHLGLYNARQTPGGVTVKVGQRRIVIPHAFIPARERSRSGAQVVRIRAQSYRAQLVGEAAFDAAVKRLPAAFVMAPGVPLIFVERAITNALSTRALERWPIELRASAAYEFARR